MDLGTVVFYKVAHKEPIYYDFNLFGFHGRPAWAMLIIKSIATRSCDLSAKSVFPSVLGETNDILLLIMVFDDYASTDDFEAPTETSLVDYVSGKDEAGFLYFKVLNEDG